MLAFAEEGATNEYQLLYVVNNTFVNDRGAGRGPPGGGRAGCGGV